MRDHEQRIESQQRPRSKDAHTPALGQRGSASVGMAALQRSAGNAAVARVLARKIGFEFEADAWHSWRRTKPVPPSEMQKAPPQRVLPPDAYEPMKKKDVIHQGNNFALEADELAGSAKVNDRAGRPMSDIEFVTEPFEETPEGLEALARTMRTIAAVADGLTKMPQADEVKGNFNWFEQLAGAGLNPTAGAMMDFGDRPMKVKMQSSFGLRLDQVAYFMASMGSAQPGESSGKRKERRKGRELMAQHRHGMRQEPTGMVKMGEAAAAAQRACAAYSHANHTTASDSLKGLVSIVTLYLLMGDKLGAGAPYPKAIAALMARTDFAKLFDMLPRAEKSALKTSGGQPWRDLVADATNLPLNVPVLKGGKVLQEVTRELWVDQIAEGVDVLSQEGYAALSEAMHPDITSEAFLEMAAEGPELESMGAMGSKTEGQGAQEAAIFELRAIPDMFSHTEIPRIANALGKYIAALNRGKKARYKG